MPLHCSPRTRARTDNWRAWQCYDKWNNVAPISAQTMPVLFAESKLTEPVCMCASKAVLLRACSAVQRMQCSVILYGVHC